MDQEFLLNFLMTFSAIVGFLLKLAVVCIIAAIITNKATRNYVRRKF